MLLQNVCQKGQELLCSGWGRCLDPLRAVAPQLLSCSSVALGVRCNDVLVCSATLAIKYKYAIKQTRTGRAYALLHTVRRLLPSHSCWRYLLENEDINWKIWRTWQAEKRNALSEEKEEEEVLALLAGFNRTKTKAILNASVACSEHAR